MTSPYLERPKRSLDQALIDTGRTPHELGMGEPPVSGEFLAGHNKGLYRLTRGRIAIACALGLALLAGTTFVALRSEFRAPVANTDPQELNDIVPAAGPETSVPSGQPPVKIDDWGDAPGLILDPNAPVSTEGTQTTD